MTQVESWLHCLHEKMGSPVLNTFPHNCGGVSFTDRDCKNKHKKVIFFLMFI